MRALAISFTAALLALGCATSAAPPTLERPPLRVSLLPPAVDLDKLLPADDEPLSIPADLKRHKIPIDEGSFQCNERGQACEPLPPGILLDDGTYAQLIADKSSARRLRTELAVVKDLRAKEHEAVKRAEIIYQGAIVELEKENAKLREPSRWENFKLYAGFVLGATAATLTAYGTNRALR